MVTGRTSQSSDNGPIYVQNQGIPRATNWRQELELKRLWNDCWRHAHSLDNGIRLKLADCPDDSDMHGCTGQYVWTTSISQATTLSLIYPASPYMKESWRVANVRSHRRPLVLISMAQMATVWPMWVGVVPIGVRVRISLSALLRSGPQKMTKVSWELQWTELH